MEMEQTVIRPAGRHMGWSEEESRLLWETADEAQQQGLPLKQVFERIAEQTGRRPNSIRNYYYAQVRERGGGQSLTPRFVPFEESEVEQLVEGVLRARAQGQSVRSCLQQMSGGSHSLMLRYQNKYRSVLKNRPELISAVMEKLREEGVECPPPEVRSRVHAATVDQACAALETAARDVTDGELIRACETLTQLILNGRTENRQVREDRMHVRLDLYRLALGERERAISLLCEAADELTGSIKEYLVRSEAEQQDSLPAFCKMLSERIGRLESAVSAAPGAVQG